MAFGTTLRPVDWEVTIYVRIRDGSLPANGAMVTMTSENNGGNVYSGTAGTDGRVVLEDVAEGVYSLDIALAYFQTYHEENIEVSGDLILDADLVEACLPPRIVRVNPTTCEVTWLPPVPDKEGMSEKPVFKNDTPMTKAVDKPRVLLGYNVYLDGELMGFTTALTYTFIDLYFGQYYIAGVSAVYTSCPGSAITTCPFTYFPCDFFEQPVNFDGTVNGMDVILTWGGGGGHEGYLLKYDNNRPDNAMEWYDAGGETAVRFTPLGYPCEIDEFRMYIWDGTWPPGNILNPFRIVIYDDDGPDGYPGTELAEKDVTPNHYNWISFDISDLGVSISSGDFYLAHYQLGYYPNCPPTGIDGSAAGHGRSYDHAVGVNWGPGQYDQYMIRAEVFGPQLGEQVLGSEKVHVDGDHTGGAVSINPVAPIMTGKMRVQTGKYIIHDDYQRFILLGYDIYRDNIKLNDEPLITEQYIDHPSPGNIYHYDVKSIWNMGESCPMDPLFLAIVGAEFPVPENLTATLSEDHCVLLTWNEPAITTGEWIHWDNGTNYTGIGLTSAGSFLVASRWTPEDLAPYDSMFLSRIAFFPKGAVTQYALRVWIGENAATLVEDQAVNYIIVGEWDTVMLETPIPIDTGLELWFGYECIGQPQGEHPAGCDQGPAVAGKGDMVSVDGVSWETLSSSGLNYNWNLQGWVSPEGNSEQMTPLPQRSLQNTDNAYAIDTERKPAVNAVFDRNNSLNLLGYNVWRDDSNISFVPAADTFYIDPNVPPGTYHYDLSAVYDSGESFTEGPAAVTIAAVGDLHGTVYNAVTLDPVADAAVTLQPGGYSVVTGTDGHYTLMGIPWHVYTMTVTCPAFNPLILEITVSGWTQMVDARIYPSDLLLSLPFYEDWKECNFHDQYWWFDSGQGNWSVSHNTGNTAPAAEFYWTPARTDYSYALISPYLDATDLTQYVALEFDLFLSSYNNTGQEHLKVDVWDGTGWITVASFINSGNIFWEHHAYDISAYALGRITRIRFVAHGSNSSGINNWGIDNIAVHEQPGATLDGTVTDASTGGPVEGAMVDIQGYDPVYTDTMGFYTIEVMEGTYDITYSADGYLPLTDSGINIAGITHHDVALEPEPCDPPLNLTYEIINGDVYLSWDPPEDPVNTRATESMSGRSPMAAAHADDNRFLLGYNIYRDGVKLNTDLIEPTQYVDAGLQNGTYEYCITAVYTHCESIPVCIEVLITDIGALTNTFVTVYPVPARDIVYVMVNDDIRELKIFNYTGQMVHERKVEGEKTFRVNTSGFRTGSYLVEFILDDGKVVTRKMVILK